MKIKSFLFGLMAMAIMGAGTLTASAQTKVAHIASQELIEAMPSYTQAKKDLKNLEDTYDAEIKGMVKELQTLAERYDREASSQSDESNGARIEEVQGRQQRIAEYRQKALEDLRKKEIDALKPITEKAREAVLRVARAKGFDYVLDSTIGTGVILADGYDLMADVKKDLGI